VTSRSGFAFLVAFALLINLSTASPAQQVRTIKVSLVSFKFDPDVLTLNEGDRVILQLQNIDKERPHSFASPYFSTVDLTVRGDAKQDVTKDGWKTIILEPGTKAEAEFVARGRGQWTFICSLYNHASRGQTGALIVWPQGYNTKP
jgi:uncharacterized cupredoxin-like copper-binding protein